MASSVFRNVSWVLGGEILGKVFHVFFFLLAANYLGVSGFGFLSSALAFFGLFGFLMDMGLYQLSVREIARHRDSAKVFMSHVFGLKILLCLVIYFFVPSVAYSLGYGQVFVGFLFLVGLSFFLDSLMYSFLGVFQGFERLDYVAYCRILGGVTVLLSGVVFYFLDYGVWGMGLAYVAYTLVPLLFCLYIVHTRFFRPVVSFDAGVFRGLLGESWPFGLTLFLTSIILSFDIVAISYFRGDGGAGIYSAASKMILALSFFITAYNQAVYPVLSRLHKRISDFNNVSGFYLSNMFFLGVPMVFLVSANSTDIISLFYSRDYLESAGVLSVLVWGMFFAFVGSPFHRVLDASGRQTLVFKTVLFACLLNVLLNIVLIPLLGLLGAAYASVASYMVLFILPAIFCGGCGLTPHISKQNVFALAVSSLTLLIALYLVSDLQFWFRLILPSLSYVLVYLFFGGMNFIIPKKKNLW